jgi:uncharacterized protein (TIGR02270 family)
MAGADVDTNEAVSAVETPDVLEGIVAQHVDEAAYLRELRTRWRCGAAVRLQHLERIDERIAAHLDGLALAGAAGVRRIHRALDRPGRGSLFVAAVRAIEDRDSKCIDHVLALGQALPTARPGVVSAFGWVSAASLRGTVGDWFGAADPWLREVALAACAMHGVNPGAALTAALEDGDPAVRACALRVCGLCGRVDLLQSCRAAIGDPELRCHDAAIRSALLLGDRDMAIEAFERRAIQAASAAGVVDVLELVLRAASPPHAHALLAPLARDPAHIRDAIRGAASVGDPNYVPWLIARMAEPAFARVAGEAFSTVTGAELARFGLDIRWEERSIEAREVGVEIVEDDGLPWPDAAKVGVWWREHGGRFVPGTRYFMGGVPTPDKCLDVLRTGAQRQRVAAADYLTLLAPGTLLFNTAAPAWRQKRLLARMGA